MERFKQVSRSERASVLYKDIFFYFAGKRFFFLYSWCDFFTGEEKRSVLYYSDISDMFPVTGGNFIHTCMHVHIVFAGVRVCVRAGRRVCVCVKQIHTHSRRVFASVAAGAGSGARLRCQTRELPSVAVGAGGDGSGTHSSRELAGWTQEAYGIRVRPSRRRIFACAAVGADCRGWGS